MRFLDNYFLLFFDHLFHLGAGQFGPFFRLLEFPVIEVVLGTLKETRDGCRIRSYLQYLFHKILGLRERTESALLL